MVSHYDGVSIILPVFCRDYSPSWIADFHNAVSSVLSQKCSLPMEIIIIDDGSVEPVDSQVALRTLLGDQRIRVIRLLRNNGIIFALNVGLNLARYQLIGRIDSDDLWRPDKLQKQLSLMMADPELTIVGTGMRMIHDSESGSSQDLIRPGNWEGILRFTAEVGCPFPHGSILARKDIFYLLGGYSHDVRKVHCEDFALWGIWLRFFKAAMIEEALYEYHVSEKTISSVHAEQQRRASGAVHAEYLKLPYDKIPTAIATLSRNLGLSVLQTGRACYTAWRFYTYIISDVRERDELTVLLPDRQVITLEEVNNHLGDRFFYFSPYCCPVGSHARCIHCLSQAAQVM